MSRHGSRVHSITISEGDGLAVIREEQNSPFLTNAIPSRTNSGGKSKEKEDEIPPIHTSPHGNVKYTSNEVAHMIKEREAELRAEFDKDLKNQLQLMTDRFDFVLQNEQVRTCYMLREAHRERKEKIQALQTQLECKNMTGLMYVLCSERRKCKMEKLKIIEEYTKYIHTLQDILTQGQLLILHLSRGYKTAARVDHEWREKMKSIVREVLCIYSATQSWKGIKTELNVFIQNVCHFQAFNVKYVTDTKTVAQLFDFYSCRTVTFFLADFSKSR